jgi:hypothetical protein
MTTDGDISGFEPPHASSPTDHILTELELHGYRPLQGEPDQRPLPEPNVIGGAVADIFDALVATLRETRLEQDLDDLLWSTVNLFHGAVDRVQRQLDDNEDAQKRSQKEQDGSEIRSVELERLLAQGTTLIGRRDSMEFFRDQAAEQFERHTGSAWCPRAGSMVNHRTLTAAMIDSRDFLAAKRRAETEVLLPAGPKIAFTGGLNFNDHHAVWDGSTRFTPSIPIWCCCMAAVRRAPSGSPPAGPTLARFRRSRSSPTGPTTPRPPRSSATIRCSRSYRSGSSSFPALASRPTWPTRRRSSAFPFGSPVAPYERRRILRERAARDSKPVAHLLRSLGAKVVVAAHPTDFIVTEDAMTIAIILSVAGLGFLCWLAFNLAVHALPFFAPTGSLRCARFISVPVRTRPHL